MPNVIQYRVYFLPLHSLRISGNAEERPPNVKQPPTARGASMFERMLVPFFLFHYKLEYLL